MLLLTFVVRHIGVVGLRDEAEGHPVDAQGEALLGRRVVQHDLHRAETRDQRERHREHALLVEAPAHAIKWLDKLME